MRRDKRPPSKSKDGGFQFYPTRRGASVGMGGITTITSAVQTAHSFTKRSVCREIPSHTRSTSWVWLVIIREPQRLQSISRILLTWKGSRLLRVVRRHPELPALLVRLVASQERAGEVEVLLRAEVLSVKGVHPELRNRRAAAASKEKTSRGFIHRTSPSWLLLL